MNYRVIAQSGLKIRSGPGINYEEEAEPIPYGFVAVGADVPTTDPGWVPILLEDDSIGWVARRYVTEDRTDFREEEAARIRPPAPAGLPIFQRDLAARYGYPKNNAPYLKIIDLRAFAGALGHVRDFLGNPWFCRIWGHEALDSPLNFAFRLLVARNLAGELRTYDGCFNIRKMTSGQSYSVHSWGLAVDFNARQNPYGGEVTFSDDFIMCFAEAGFESGALWSTPDGMHFQLPWTRDWRESGEELRPRL